METLGYYHKTALGAEHPNSWYIQRKRVYDRIMETKHRPTDKAILKYGIRFDQQNRVIIPEDLSRPTNRKVEISPITADQSIEYLENNFKPRGAPLTPAYYNKLKSFKTILRNPDDVAEDINSPDFVEYVVKKWPNPGTAAQKLWVVLAHIDNYPRLKDVVKTRTEIEREMEKMRQGHTDKAMDKREEEIPNWEDVLKKIKDKFGENSEENLFFQVYDEAPIRTEFGRPIPIVAHDSGEGNYLSGNTLKIHDFKTAGKHPTALIFKLSPRVMSLIPEGRKTLLKDNKHFARWIVDTLKEIGIEVPDVKQYASFLRHMVASWRNGPENKTKPKGKELALMMGHTRSMQEQVYAHHT